LRSAALVVTAAIEVRWRWAFERWLLAVASAIASLWARAAIHIPMLQAKERTAITGFARSREGWMTIKTTERR
jgi:hypothetical protein